MQRGKTSRINDRIELFDEIFENLEYINLCLPRLITSFTHIEQYRTLNQQTTKDAVSQSINFMLDNINRKFSLQEIASVVNLSASHFSRLFLSRTGHSPINYFIQLKIQRSCHLLDNTVYSIAEIARETGFEDQFYFSRQFRRVMNMSPRKYRKRNKKPIPKPSIIR